MHLPTDDSRRFWRSMLAGGGLTAVPRWTLEPRTGIAVHEVPVPAEHLVALHLLAEQAGVSPEAVLLTAHVRVLATLSGEREVVTGYAAAPAGAAVPCRVSAGSGSWRSLLQDVGRLEWELQWHAGTEEGPVSLDDVCRELALSGPLFETVVDPDGRGGPPAPTTVLHVEMPGDETGRTLRLRYRTDALDASAAGRIAGYHLAALALMATAPDAEHSHACLLSGAELRLQLEDLAGPRRELPDRRVHELFQDRAKLHPDAVAAVQGDRRWTYAQLNARANRTARALDARRLGREAVVTVVMERSLEWLTTVLAIWKAGLTYLPLEPHFPAGRIATAISRAESPLVVTEPGSTQTLDEALTSLPGVQVVRAGDLLAEGHGEEDLDITVTAGQLAYILFTSGSTGQPKGVMCEHGGMLNHIYAKIDDLGVQEGEVVPQTGPQCFDISVWQLVAALLVGGRTLVVEQDVILDAERFIDTMVDGRAGVLQVVPSYLDVLVTYLEDNPRDLPDLHCICPTGDFLKKELVERWFALYPGIPMVNTYGLTETSDDAVHEVMERAPGGSRIPLGRPINNTHVDVVDDQLNPVPLGAPGLIVFSGICVGRGYVNDPERTAQVFAPDPHRAGERICRTGDYGRWRPDGKLDFLGRRDNQVKIRGFRIEIGEIEDALLRLPGVRDGAVVVAEATDRAKLLVAWYSGERPVQTEQLRAGLGERVPDYMVPTVYHWRESLPLTANGKIDRTTLAGMASELVSLDIGSAAGSASTPRTSAERRLATAWGEVLGVAEERIGRHDSFFDLGGTSLSAVKLVVLLERAVSLKDITGNPVLADLARVLETTPAWAARTTGGSR